MKTALLLLYVSVFRRPLQHKKLLYENTSSLRAETIREKLAHTRASQTLEIVAAF